MVRPVPSPRDPLRPLLVRDELRPFFLDDRGLNLLDQRLLPDEEHWTVLMNPSDVVEHTAEAIEGLAVRGAPAIGGAAALALACFARRPPKVAPDVFVDTLRRADTRLRRTRPTAVNLFVALDAVAHAVGRAFESDGTVHDIAAAVIDAAEDYLLQDEAACVAMGAAGASLLQDGDLVVTICHTGALATCGQGTALGVVKSARKQGKNVGVLALETRPLLQGARLTTWECMREGIPVTLITDGMAAFALQKKRVTRALVGADRIAQNGDTANKIGTFSLAVACAHHGIPFHVVAPRTTIDVACADGDAIRIEERFADEVRRVRGNPIAPLQVPVWNPAFDVTAASLIASFITNAGIAQPPFFTDDGAHP